MQFTVDELRRKARYAGFLYLLLGLTAPIGLLYVPGKLFVPVKTELNAIRDLRSADVRPW
jgi:hypothetical protein